MQILALLAQKGGAGKTSLALALAVEAGGAGKTAIVLDTDPQASACRWRDRRQVRDPVVIDVQPSRLQNALGAAAEQGVDLVVIDTPPRSESAALEAARVAHLVVIPCRAQILDLETVPATQQLLALAGNPPARRHLERRSSAWRASRPSAARHCGALVCRFVRIPSDTARHGATLALSG